MDIACPHCAATYRVPASLVAGGKALRCAACSQEWVPQLPGREATAIRGPMDSQLVGEVVAAAPAPLAPLSAAPVSTADPPPLMPRREPGQRAADERPRVPAMLPAAWIASVAAVVLGLAALYLYRAPLAVAWPPLGRL
ncbi:MAG TPA: zinc-ribbon domain-containing protein, partial [Roseococcus sp.]|nr:zinc-ribbon domain-containing protein [Roseococcus sp.]